MNGLLKDWLSRPAVRGGYSDFWAGVRRTAIVAALLVVALAAAAIYFW